MRFCNGVRTSCRMQYPGPLAEVLYMGGTGYDRMWYSWPEEKNSARQCCGYCARNRLSAGATGPNSAELGFHRAKLQSQV